MSELFTLTFSFVERYSLFFSPSSNNPLRHNFFFSSADPPTVDIQTSDLEDLEDKKDDATIRCVVDSNPQSKVTWRKEKAGDAVISSESEIIFSPVSRMTAGLYSCVAENPLGMSKPAFVELDVKCE